MNHPQNSQLKQSLHQQHQNNFIYQPPTQQEYQYQIYINNCDQYISSQLIEQFRNDHLIEANPNIIVGSLNQSDSQSVKIDQGVQIPGVNSIINKSNQRLYNSVLIQADIIIFVLNQNNTQELQYILKLFKNSQLPKEKRLICITELLSWSKGREKNQTYKIKYDQLHLRSSVDYHLKMLENMCLGIHNENQKIKGSVIFSGLVYGLGEDRLFTNFKRALEQEKPLQIYGKGTNYIPMVHLRDLCQITFNIAFQKFNSKKNWHFAVDDSKLSQKQLISFISSNLGNGNVIEKAIDDCFLKDNLDFFTLDLEINQNDKEKLTQWYCKNGLISSFQTIVGEFNEYRGLKPNKIIIIGPPASGKTTIAQILKSKYGLPIINIKNLIEDIKSDQTQFGQQIRTLLQEIKIQKVQQQRKVYQEMKKKKKGKGVEDFDPEKVVARLPDEQLAQVLKWRLNFSDCLNKGYIIDNAIKTYNVAEKTFSIQNNQINLTILPNSIFNIKATDDQIKQRVKGLPLNKTQGTHWTEEQTIRRLQTYQKENQQKAVRVFFENIVDIENVEFNYQSPEIFGRFIERNGPLGFSKQPDQNDPNLNVGQNVQQTNGQNRQQDQQQEQDVQQQEQKQEQQFNLQKLTPKQQKILNEKSRPIRQYLIDNVIPQITEGLLEICKDIPEDPIEFLIEFLEKKNVKHKK